MVPIYQHLNASMLYKESTWSCLWLGWMNTKTGWWQLKDFWNFHPDPWGKWSNLTNNFSNGLVQPPTRYVRHFGKFFWFSIIWGKLSQACHKAINVSVRTKHIPFRHVVILAIWSLISNRFTIHMRFPSFSSICWFARPKAFSADHGAALLKDGRMFLWGSNRFGQSPGVVSVGICRNIPLAESDSEWFGANLPWFLRYVFFWQRFCSWISLKRTRVGELVGFLWWDYVFSSGGHQKSKGDRAPPVDKHILFRYTDANLNERYTVVKRLWGKNFKSLGAKNILG